MNSKIRAAISATVTLLIGSSSGLLVGGLKGAAWATNRDRDNCVSKEDYSRVCDQNESIAQLYFAERTRNVQLSRSHLAAMRLVKHPSPSR